MDFISRNLEKNERVMATARLSILAFIPHLFCAAAMFVTSGYAHKYITMQYLNYSDEILKAFGWILIAVVILNMFFSYFIATDRRVIFKSGFLCKKWLEVRYSRIESINLKQRLFTKFVAYGEICVITTSAREIKFRKISAPMCLKKAIDAGLSVIGL